MSGKLWPATNGLIPKTPDQWRRHFDYMAEKGRALRAAQAEHRRRQCAAGVENGSEHFFAAVPLNGCDPNIMRQADGSVEVEAGREKGETR
jgi:hypothetical protein